MIFIIIILGLTAFFLSLIVRLLPFLSLKPGGCDAYYFLLCVEEFKKNRRIPIVLPPYYLLEQQEQWYPPGFTVFLSCFPDKFLKKYHWLISPFLDSVIGMGVFYVSYFLFQDLKGAFLASLIYAFSRSTIIETQSLTSRQLGSFLFNLSLFSLFLFLLWNEYLFLSLFFLFGMMLLLTHKLSTQMLFLGVMVWAIVIKNITVVLFLIALFILTILLTKGFYLKVLKAHWDIIKFWQKNFPFLRAHQVYNSSVYGNEKGVSNEYRNFSVTIKHTFKMLLVNLYIFSILYFCFNSSFPYEFKIISSWIFAALIVILAIIFFPFLRGIGEGFKYMKLLVPSIAVLGGYLCRLDYLFFLVLIWYIGVYFYWLKNFVKSDFSIREDRDIEKMLDFIRDNAQVSKIICLPCNFSDMIAFYTRKQVFWGGHNYSLKWLEDYFPVLRKKISDLAKEYNLTHFFVDISYVDVSLFKDEVKEKVFSSGKYELYKL